MVQWRKNVNLNKVIKDIPGHSLLVFAILQFNWIFVECQKVFDTSITTSHLLFGFITECLAWLFCWQEDHHYVWHMTETSGTISGMSDSKSGKGLELGAHDCGSICSFSPRSCPLGINISRLSFKFYFVTIISYHQAVNYSESTLIKQWIKYSNLDSAYRWISFLPHWSSPISYKFNKHVVLVNTVDYFKMFLFSGSTESSCSVIGWNYTQLADMGYEAALEYVKSHTLPPASPCINYSYDEDVPHSSTVTEVRENHQKPQSDLS